MRGSRQGEPLALDMKWKVSKTLFMLSMIIIVPDLFSESDLTTAIPCVSYGILPAYRESNKPTRKVVWNLEKVFSSRVLLSLYATSILPLVSPSFYIINITLAREYNWRWTPGYRATCGAGGELGSCQGFLVSLA